MVIIRNIFTLRRFFTWNVTVVLKRQTIQTKIKSEEQQFISFSSRED